MNKIKILSFTTLYPNLVQPRHGIFVEQRLKKLLESNHVEIKVIAPVPWFPFKSKRFGEYAKYAQVPRKEQRFGIDIYHPRYIVIPKIGMLLTPFFLAITGYLKINKIVKAGYEFDLIDAHYYYPDGISASILGKIFAKPVTVTARGTDVNLIPHFVLPKKMILWAANQVSASYTVCEALRAELINLGADSRKIQTLRNGVDLDLFVPKNRKELRENRKIENKCFLSVGHLIERKGHHLIIEAMVNFPDSTLLIVGDGEKTLELQALTEKLNLTEQVIFLGALTHSELVDIYNIADLLILASSREGWANVLLESMACGTPVVATNIWGTPEVVNRPEAGVLIKERTTAAIVNGIKMLLNHYPDRKKTREYAENFSWGQTINALEKSFSDIIGK